MNNCSVTHFIGMNVSREAQRDTKIIKFNTSEFELTPLKLKIAKILKNYNAKVMVDTKLCRSLKCKCIATQDDISYSQSNTIDAIQNEKDKQLDNDVSNACLTLIRFFILDGRRNISSNLDLLYKESEKFLDKQRGPDEVMVEVIYPAYVKLFDQKYRKLKLDSNYTDTFIYDQRIANVHKLTIIFKLKKSTVNWYSNKYNLIFSGPLCI